jgi:hypothetical protein
VDSTIYTKILILGVVLMGHVLGNDFVGHIPGTTAEVAAPTRASPKTAFSSADIPPINDGQSFPSTTAEIG